MTVSWNVPTAIDNAGPFMSTSSHVPPFDFPVGVHTVTYTFEDTRGLTSICEFNVMVTGETLLQTFFSVTFAFQAYMHVHGRVILIVPK